VSGFFLKGNGTFFGFAGTDGGNGGKVLVVVVVVDGGVLLAGSSPGSGESARFFADLLSSGDRDARRFEPREFIWWANERKYQSSHGRVIGFANHVSWHNSFHCDDCVLVQ
jgi:hypothetical protein